MRESLTPLLRLMQNMVTGPRDWYEIKHCKTGKGKPYFFVRICVWENDWPGYGDGESVYLAQAVKHAIADIESTPEKAEAK